MKTDCDEVLRQPTQQLALDLIEAEAPTLENFVVGDNAELIESLRRCRAGAGPQFVYIWGPPGSGRTHLLRSLTPSQRWRVSEFDETVPLYTVDNVELLDDEDLEKLFHLMNAVRSHPGTHIVVAGAQPVAALVDGPRFLAPVPSKAPQGASAWRGAATGPTTKTIQSR